MNYLAHLYLAGQEEELIVGNFIADSVKGSRFTNFPHRISQGILMHRAIDHFSDTHPVYLKSVHRFAPGHGKFSGVITDMVFDHLLALHWSDFSEIPLTDFTEATYVTLHKYRHLMPEESKVILKYMSQHNWLLSYKNLEGIRRALKGLSQRMKYYHPMDEAIREFEKDLSAYTKDFYEFFPLLKLHIQPFTKGAT